MATRNAITRCKQGRCRRSLIPAVHWSIRSVSLTGEMTQRVSLREHCHGRREWRRNSNTRRFHGIADDSLGGEKTARKQQPAPHSPLPHHPRPIIIPLHADYWSGYAGECGSGRIVAPEAPRLAVSHRPYGDVRVLHPLGLRRHIPNSLCGPTLLSRPESNSLVIGPSTLVIACQTQKTSLTRSCQEIPGSLPDSVIERDRALGRQAKPGTRSG